MTKIRFRTLAIAAALVVALSTAQVGAAIILVDEDFSVDAGSLTGGNGAATFTAGGGVGSLSGDGSSNFISIGTPVISIPEFALGGELIFRVEQLAGPATPVSRFLQINVDGANPFSGDQFGSTDGAATLIHDDDGDVVGSQTIAAGTTDIVLLYATTNGFGANPVPASEVARISSFFAEFVPAIPEPASAALLVCGGLAVLGRRV